jgi:hypothetical protein
MNSAQNLAVWVPSLLSEACQVTHVLITKLAADYQLPNLTYGSLDIHTWRYEEYVYIYDELKVYLSKQTLN